MKDTIERLTAALSEKETILEKLVLLLDRERSRIVEVDAAGIDAEREDKMHLIECLEQAKADCRKAIEEASLAAGLPRDATLSTLVGAIDSPRQAALSASRKRVIELIEVLNRSNRCNRDLLFGSLRMVNRSLEFYNHTLGSAKTYSDAGRLVTGMSGGRLVSGEI